MRTVASKAPRKSAATWLASDESHIVLRFWRHSAAEDTSERCPCNILSRKSSFSSAPSAAVKSSDASRWSDSERSGTAQAPAVVHLLVKRPSGSNEHGC